MPTGLPFQSMPAAVAGTPKLLGNLQTKQDETVYPQQLGRMERDPATGLMEPVYTEADYQRGPDPMGRPVVEMAPMPQRQEIPDPVAALTEQSSAALEQALATVKSKRGELEKSIQPDIDRAYQEYLIDLETLNKSDMDLEQKKQRNNALHAGYQKKKLGVQSGIRADLEALTQAEEQAKGKIELKRLTTQAKMQAIAAVGQEYGWSPYEVKRQQYKAMGMVLPAEEKPKELTPVETLGEMNRYRSALEDTALRVRYNKSGQLEYDDSTTKTTNWQVVTDPARAAALEQTANTYLALGGEIERIAKEGGRKHVDLAAVSGRSAVPTPPGGGWSRGAIARKLFAPTAAYDSAKWAYGMSPLAKGVAQARNDAPPATRASADPNDVSQLSDAELRRIAGVQ